MSALQKYREEQKFLFNFKQKYSKLIEIDDTKRRQWNLIHFMKKRLLFDVINKTSEEISEIDGIFRFRCYIFRPIEEFRSEYEIETISFQNSLDIIKLESDSSLQNTMKQSLNDERRKSLKIMIIHGLIIKYPIMLDLRLYGLDPNMPIMYDDEIYHLDDDTQDRLRREYEKVNPSTLAGEKFFQIIKHSKALCAYYNKSKV